MKHEYMQQQEQIRFVKTFFSHQLEQRLGLIEVHAPLLSQVGDGIQDNLSGKETAVSVTIKALPNNTYEIVHSLAKWKRKILGDFGFEVGDGIYTHMKALRPDEETLSATHSVFVDQWDWEQVIGANERHIDYLKEKVTTLYQAIKDTEMAVNKAYQLDAFLPDAIEFIHAEELLRRYPHLTPKARERAITKQFGAVFVMGIGGGLSNGEPHDVRAADYDDWSSLNEAGLSGLNGDILVWNPVIDDVLELSSMGIRVNATSLQHQLTLTKHTERLALDWHQQLIAGVFPQTIGGGIGQSRLVMLLLKKRHIGQVQCSVWSHEIPAI